MNCERHLAKKKRCPNKATAFMMGQNVCGVHEHKGDEHCTHSLAPSGRCAYCGAHTEADRAVRTAE